MNQSVKCLPHRHETLSPGFVFYSQAGWLLFALSLREAETGRALNSRRMRDTTSKITVVRPEEQ